MSGRRNQPRGPNPLIPEKTRSSQNHVISLHIPLSSTGQIRARKIGKKYFVTEQDVKGFILAQETNVETAKTEENDPYLGAIRED